MNKPKGPRYAVGSAPTNRRRTAVPARAGLPDPTPWRRKQALLRLGIPLVQAIRHQGLPRRALAQGGLGLASLLAAAGLLVSAPGWTAAALAVGGSAGLVTMWWSLRRRARSANLAAGLGPPALPPAAWQALDQLLEQVAADAPEPLLLQLTQVKQTLLRVTRAAAAIGIDPHFTLDDHFYLQECVRRYLPDALGHFVRMPVDQRGMALVEGSAEDSAHATLARQLDLIEAGLREREQRCARSAGQALLAHERFLQQKSQD